LNKIPSFLLHLIDNDNAIKFVMNNRSIKKNINDLDMYVVNVENNLPRKLVDSVDSSELSIKYNLDFNYLIKIKYLYLLATIII